MVLISQILVMQAINEKILSLGFAKCKVHLSVVDAQHTIGGGVLLMVKGTLSNNGAAPRKFMQTFLLAVQQPSGYFVRNDILRFLAEDEPKQAPSASTGTPNLLAVFFFASYPLHFSNGDSSAISQC